MTVDTLHAVTFYTIYAVTVHVICTVLLARNKKIEKNGYASWKKILKTVVGVHGYWGNRI